MNIVEIQFEVPREEGGDYVSVEFQPNRMIFKTNCTQGRLIGAFLEIIRVYAVEPYLAYHMSRPPKGEMWEKPQN